MGINFHLLDRPYFLRRIIFTWTLVIATYAIFWMFKYAEESTRNGVEVAAIIGAINAPLAFLVTTILNAWKDIPEPKAATLLGGDS